MNKIIYLKALVAVTQVNSIPYDYPDEARVYADEITVGSFDRGILYKLKNEYPHDDADLGIVLTANAPDTIEAADWDEKTIENWRKHVNFATRELLIPISEFEIADDASDEFIDRFKSLYDKPVADDKPIDEEALKVIAKDYPEEVSKVIVKYADANRAKIGINPSCDEVATNMLQRRYAFEMHDFGIVFLCDEDGFYHWKDSNKADSKWSGDFLLYEDCFRDAHKYIHGYKS